jgi:hypothetical protein
VFETVIKTLQTRQNEFKTLSAKKDMESVFEFMKGSTAQKTGQKTHYNSSRDERG